MQQPQTGLALLLEVSPDDVLCACALAADISIPEDLWGRCVSGASTESYVVLDLRGTRAPTSFIRSSSILPLFHSPTSLLPLSAAEKYHDEQGVEA